jgi:hypothetical protein
MKKKDILQQVFIGINVAIRLAAKGDKGTEILTSHLVALKEFVEREAKK